MGPRLKVSSDRLVKPVIKPATPGLQGKLFIHYTTAAYVHQIPSEYKVLIKVYIEDKFCNILYVHLKDESLMTGM